MLTMYCIVLHVTTLYIIVKDILVSKIVWKCLAYVTQILQKKKQLIFTVFIKIHLQLERNLKATVTCCC
jgi:hypothetical protein